MLSFAVRNFGCRANQAEAFAWADAFRERGLRLDEDWARSEVVVVNSCTLTGRAERDVRKFIRAVHRENPQGRIVVTGCYAERAPAEIAGLPGVVSVLPQSAKDGLAERLLAIGAAKGPANLPEGVAFTVEAAVGPPFRAQGCADRADRGHADRGHVPEVRVPDFSFRARGWIKVQDGCDNRCAYCVIPAVRGRSRSVAAAAVKAQVAELAGRGFREIVLAGIDLSSYGEDLEPRGSLAGLLGELREAAGSARLRLSSLDPRKCDGPLLAAIAADPRLCPHFHFSFQHASGRMLGLMGRPVEAGSYASLLKAARALSPDAALGADLMVGFPGETDADFEELEAFVETSPLTYAHVFSFSPRPGTPAASRPPVPDGVITARAKALRRAAALKDLGFRRRFVGRALEAVIIARSEHGAEALTGNFIRIFVPDRHAPARERVRVAVRRALAGRLEGEIVP